MSAGVLFQKGVCSFTDMVVCFAHMALGLLLSRRLRHIDNFPSLSKIGGAGSISSQTGAKSINQSVIDRSAYYNARQW